MDDMTSFLAGFAAVFLGLAAYLWHLERRAGRLERRLQALEAAAKGKNQG